MCLKLNHYKYMDFFFNEYFLLSDFFPFYRNTVCFLPSHDILCNIRIRTSLDTSFHNVKGDSIFYLIPHGRRATHGLWGQA